MKELFNLWHAQLHNVVERIFGIIKRRWSIFTHAQEYPIETQARFVSTIRALHNFIRVHRARLAHVLAVRARSELSSAAMSNLATLLRRFAPLARLLHV